MSDYSFVEFLVNEGVKAERRDYPHYGR